MLGSLRKDCFETLDRLKSFLPNLSRILQALEAVGELYAPWGPKNARGWNVVGFHIRLQKLLLDTFSANRVS
jgi:hypothetical protein